MTYVDFDGITVIESLRSNEPQTGTALYQHLQAHLQAGSVTLSHHPVTSRAAFFTVLDRIQRAATASGTAPLIHLEVHGNQEGLDINNGDDVSWVEFADRCRDINIALKNHLVVTLAVCKGAHALSGINPMWRAPFFGIIGSFDIDYSPTLATGFQAFYDALLTKQDFNIAHADLCKHLPRFRLIDSTGLFLRAYETYRKEHLTPDVLQTRIDDIAAYAPTSLPEQTVRDYAQKTLVAKDQNRREKLWHNFVMVDLDKNNALRCPLPNQ